MQDELARIKYQNKLLGLEDDIDGAKYENGIRLDKDLFKPEATSIGELPFSPISNANDNCNKVGTLNSLKDDHSELMNPPKPVVEKVPDQLLLSEN